MNAPTEALNPHVANAWFKRPIWRTWASDLFRYYSQRRHYRVRFNPALETACVNMTTRDVQIGTTVSIPKSSVRYGGGDLHTARLRQIEAMVAHEAGHARFSIVQPQGGALLHQLWNILEDQRIEWLMARDHANLKNLFTMLGDMFLGEILESGTAISGLNACLAWRWGHNLRVKPPISEPRWDEVRPLVEQAWVASDSAAVIEIAKEILALLTLDPEAIEQPLQRPVSAPTGRDPSDPAPAGTDPALAGADSDPADSDPASPGDQSTPCTQEGDQPASATPPSPDANKEGSQPGGQQAGNGADDGGDDIRPDNPGAGEAILEDIEPAARRIAVKLAPREQPIRNRPSVGRGRFAYDRHVSGSTRPFLEQNSPRRHKPLALTLLIDTSYSMSGKRIQCAVQTAATLQRASELSGSPFRAASFDSVHTLIEGVNAEAVRDEICELYANGGTVLSPSLRWALTPHSPTHRAVVIVVSDGALLEADATVCHALAIQATRAGTTIVPVLIGGDVSAAQYEETFGRSLAVSNVNDLASTLESWLGGVASA